MKKGPRLVSDHDSALEACRVELAELMSAFNPDVAKVSKVLSQMKRFSSSDEQARSLGQLLSFFKEKSGEPDFSPSLDCRFPFFWKRFSSSWLKTGPVLVEPNSKVVRLFEGRSSLHQQSAVFVDRERRGLLGATAFALAVRHC
ncbi:MULTISPECIES: hypothetical protein [unclassified Chelatococcus]|uniref:hypothetical protein n=1 Tax=unclassified Chelatococcus TaxID=2638111 RepID=UPI001BCE5B94|nr:MULTISPECIES: hypothetical protein [unclassified Chelatococcus]MBS7700060.1 hypothetical protein [Chelatococcus sp. YT9]MBX3556753.1 hypothetical protein [Chelatococcus sp.]